MAKSCGIGGTPGLSTPSDAHRLGQGRAGVRLARSFGWLPGPGDGSMSPSLRGMNNVYIHTHTHTHTLYLC
jgi:hypothetical protein